MGYSRKINELLDERNELVHYEERVELWDVMDAYDDPVEAIHALRAEIKALKERRDVFKLTRVGLGSFEELTTRDIIDDIIPDAEKRGKDLEPIQIVIAGRTMEIPLNAGSYQTIIESIKKCWHLENE